MKRIVALAAVAAAALGLSACGLFERSKTIDITLSSPTPVDLVAGQAVGLTAQGSLAIAPASTVDSTIVAINPKSDPDVDKYLDDIDRVELRGLTFVVSRRGPLSLATEVSAAVLTIVQDYKLVEGAVQGTRHYYALEFTPKPWKIDRGDSTVTLTGFTPSDATGKPITGGVAIGDLLDSIVKAGNPFGVGMTVVVDGLPVDVSCLVAFRIALEVTVKVF